MWATLHGITKRWYKPPGKRGWSKQHPKIRTPRPLVDRFTAHREHPEKEWWRERRIAPPTFMGFPDLANHKLHGGSLYTEQMDSQTLAVICDKAIKDGFIGPEYDDVWEKFVKRALQLCSRTENPDICYLFRAICKADPKVESDFLPTFQGRIKRRLPHMDLKDCAILIEGFLSNPRFFHQQTFDDILIHCEQLLFHRDDFDISILGDFITSLPALQRNSSASFHHHLRQGERPWPTSLDPVLGQYGGSSSSTSTTSQTKEHPSAAEIFGLTGVARWNTDLLEQIYILLDQHIGKRDINLLDLSLQAKLIEILMRERPHSNILKILSKTLSERLNDIPPNDLIHLARASQHEDVVIPGLNEAVRVTAYKVPVSLVSESSYYLDANSNSELIAPRADELDPLAAAHWGHYVSSDENEMRIFNQYVVDNLIHFDDYALAMLLSSTIHRKGADLMIAEVALQTIHGRLDTFNHETLPLVVKALSKLNPRESSVHRDIISRCISTVDALNTEALTLATEGLAGYLRAANHGDDLAQQLIQKIPGREFTPTQAARCLCSLYRFPAIKGRDDVATLLAPQLGPSSMFSASQLIDLATALGGSPIWRKLVEHSELAYAIEMKRYDVDDDAVTKVVKIWENTLPGLRAESVL